MKFAFLKALSRPGVMTTDWKNYTQLCYQNHPEALEKDYERLVQSIADLELIEKYLREEVLHKSEETAGLRSVMSKAVELGTLVAPFLQLFRIHGATEVVDAIDRLNQIGLNSQAGFSRSKPLNPISR